MDDFRTVPGSTHLANSAVNRDALRRLQPNWLRRGSSCQSRWLWQPFGSCFCDNGSYCIGDPLYWDWDPATGAGPDASRCKGRSRHRDRHHQQNREGDRARATKTRPGRGRDRDRATGPLGLSGRGTGPRGLGRTVGPGPGHRPQPGPGLGRPSNRDYARDRATSPDQTKINLYPIP